MLAPDELHLKHAANMAITMIVISAFVIAP